MHTQQLSLLAISVAFVLAIAGTTATADEAETVASIKKIMIAQQNAWNAGDVDEFMIGYWKSDELTFSSGGKTVRGWQATLDRYRKRYPDKSAMGTLTFSDLEATLLGKDAAFVLGRWQLKRTEPIGGNFSLVWRQIDGNWRIVHDHSSALDEK